MKCWSIVTHFLWKQVPVGGPRTELLQRWSRTTNPPRTVAEVLAIQSCPCLERNGVE